MATISPRRVSSSSCSVAVVVAAVASWSSCSGVMSAKSSRTAAVLQPEGVVFHIYEELAVRADLLSLVPVCTCLGGVKMSFAGYFE